MNSSKAAPTLATGQALHFTSLAILLLLITFAWFQLGKPSPVTFWVAVSLPIVHQIFVWLTWRLELLYSSTSSTIGFSGYVFGFFVLFLGRFITLAFLAWTDRGSYSLAVFHRVVISALPALIGIYAMYSVLRYFGLARASGADHFDPKYRNMPLVRKGIFRFTQNGMYVYAFLLFWAIATSFNSAAALIVAAFSHLYIWVHFYCTEKPDMDFLYGALKTQ